MAHNDEYNYALLAAQTLNRAISLGILTDTIVNASTTRQALVTAMNAIAAHNDLTNLKLELSKIIMQAPGITDATVSSATTAAGLVSLLGVPNAGQATILS